MPTLPDDQPQAEEQVTPGEIGARVAPLGEQVGQALNAAGEVAQRMHYDAVQQANEAGVTAFHNSQVQWELDHLHNPQTGVLAKQTGLSAPQTVDDTLKSYDEFTSKAIAAMPNDQQRQAANQYVAMHRQQMSDQLFNYEDKQVKTAHVQIMENGVALQSNAMVAHADDPQAVQQNLDSMKAIRQDQGRMLGWDPDTVNRFVAEDQSKASLGMLRQMVADNKSPQAQAWFSQNRSLLQGKDLTEATSMLDKKDEQDNALTIANQVMSAPRDANEPNDLQSNLTRLEGMHIQDRKLFDNAREEIVRHFDLQQQAENQRQKGILDKVGDAIDASHGQPIDPAMLVNATPATKEAAERYRQVVIKQGYAETDPAAYARLQEALGDTANLKRNFGDGGQFFADNPDLRSQLSPAHYQEMLRDVTKAQERIARNDNEWSKGNVELGMQKDLFAEAGLETTGKPGSAQREAQEALQGQFLIQLRRAIGAAQVDEQRDLKPDEKEAIAKKLFASTSWIERSANPDYVPPEKRGTMSDIEGIASGFFGSGEDQDTPVLARSVTGRVFESPEGRQQAYSWRDVPERADNPALTRASILAAAARNGIHAPGPGASYDERRAFEQMLVQGYNAELHKQVGQPSAAP